MSKLTSALVFFALLTAATLAVYVPGLSNGLVFDDARLTDGTIFDGYGSLLQLRPRLISYGSFVWLQSLFGEGWAVQRLFNVLLHLGVAGSLYLLFQNLLARTQFSAEAQADPVLAPSWLAGLRVGTALFALNPVAVYAVAYLVQRSIVMATLFVVLACLAWVRGLVTRKPVWFALAALGYALAVLSKETAFMAAALAVPLYVFVVRPPLRRTLLVAGVALLAMLAAAAALYGVFGAIVGATFDTPSRLYALQLEQLAPGVGARLYPLSVLNQAALFFPYGLLWLVPNVQWMSIDLRPAFPLSFSAFPQVLGAVGFVATLAGSAWLVLRRSDVLGLLGLCVLCPMLLFFAEFVTVWVQDPFVLYRSYLWALGLPCLIALPFIGLKPKLIYPIGVLLAALFGGLALERVASLRDEQTVWSDAVDKIDRQAEPSAVGRWRPFLNRGAYLLERERAQEAYADFVQAGTLGEPEGSAQFNTGMALSLLKKYDDALAAFAAAEAKGFVAPQLYFQVGEAHYAMRRFAPAFAAYDKALAGQKAEAEQDVTRRRRAESAIPLQKYDVAIADLGLLLKKNPADQGLMLRLGMAHVGRKDTATALSIFNQMLAAKPTGAAYYGRAMAHVVANEKDAGLRDLDQAIALEPGNAAYQNVRAQIAAQK